MKKLYYMMLLSFPVQALHHTNIKRPITPWIAPHIIEAETKFDKITINIENVIEEPGRPQEKPLSPINNNTRVRLLLITSGTTIITATITALVTYYSVHGSNC